MTPAVALSDAFVTTHMLVEDGDALWQAMSPHERRVFAALAADPRRVVTKDELVAAIAAANNRARTVVHRRTVDSAAARLSARFRAEGVRVCVNVWGVGYRLLDR